MLLGFGYLYKIVMFYFFLFFSKSIKQWIKKKKWPKFCTIFLFLLKIGLVGPVDQQINLVSPNAFYYFSMKLVQEILN